VPESKRTLASNESTEIIPVTTSPRSLSSIEGIEYILGTPVEEEPGVWPLGVPQGIRGTGGTVA
jgi:hypothetical protein